MRALSTMLCAGLLAVPALPAQGGEAAPARPGFRTLRFEEDWSVLSDPDALPSRDPFDALKYLRLSENGSAWLSLGGQARGRLEVWDGFGFGAPSDADATVLLVRLLAHADLHLTPGVRIFVQGKSALSTDPDVFGGARRNVDTDDLDLLDGFLELSGAPLELPLTVRLGRQELLFGRQRLVSPLDWSNTRRTFDVGSAELALDDWRVFGFGGRPVRVRRSGPNDHPDGSAFYGLVAQGSLPGTDLDLDLYGLGRHRDGVMLEGSAGDERRATIGGRVGGNLGETGLHFDVEGAWQGGSIGSDDVDAFMVATQVGWWGSRLRYSPRIHAAFDYASGDGSPGGDLGLFDQLFPLGHACLGYVDVVARQNIIAPSLGLTLRPLPRTTAEITALGFWRADTRSGLYNAGGSLIRAGNLGSSRQVGAELDLLVKHRIGPHILAAAGYSHFFPGRFLRQSGPDAPIDFGYLILQYTF